MTDEPGSNPAATRHETGTNPAPGRQARGVSLQEAALQLDVSERTVRRLIRDGSLQAYKQKAARGFVWRVVLDPSPADEPGTQARQDGNQTGTNPAHVDEPSGTPPAVDAPAVLDLVRLVDRLQRDNQQLAGQVGYLQAKLQDAQEQIRLLTVDQPEPEPATVDEARPRPWWKWWK